MEKSFYSNFIYKDILTNPVIIEIGSITARGVQEANKRFNDYVYIYYEASKYNFSNRNLLERVKNQVDFSFFGELSNENLVLGDKGDLFKKNHIEEFKGKTFIGRNYMEVNLKKMAFVSDKLQEKGSNLLFVLMPNKPYYLGVEKEESTQKKYGSGNAEYSKEHTVKSLSKI